MPKAGKIVVESRGLKGEHQKSHWPTLLTLMSPTPVPVQRLGFIWRTRSMKRWFVIFTYTAPALRPGDILKISESAELSQDLLTPVKYSFQGELLRS